MWMFDVAEPRRRAATCVSLSCFCSVAEHGLLGLDGHAQVDVLRGVDVQALRLAALAVVGVAERRHARRRRRRLRARAASTALLYAALRWPGARSVRRLLDLLRERASSPGGLRGSVASCSLYSRCWRESSSVSRCTSGSSEATASAAVRCSEL